MRLRILIACITAIALALAGCSDDDSDDKQSTTTSTTQPSTSEPPLSTAPPTGPPSTGGELSPEQCGQELFDSWAAGNQSASPPCASAAAVQQIFSEPYAAGYQGPNCDAAAGSVFCTWTSPGPALVMEIRNTTGGLPIEVISVNRMVAM